MRRFGAVLTVWAMGMAGVLTWLALPLDSASASTPAVSSGVVAQAVSLTAPAAAETGLAFGLSGYGIPARPGRVVVVERQSGASWVVAGRAVEASTGRYAVVTSSLAAGRFTYRSVALAGPGFVAVASGYRMVSVHLPYVLLTASTAMAAETVRVTGTLPGVSSRPVWVQRASGTRWLTLGKTTTSRTGSYLTSFRAPAVGSYPVRSLAPQVTIAGKVLAQYVTAAKTLRVIAQSASLSMPATIVQSGTGVAVLRFAPARALRLVALQVLRAGVWTSVATGRQSGAGTASLTLTAGAPGAHSYRAYTAAAAGAAAFASPSRTLSVTTAPAGGTPTGPVTDVSAVPAPTSITLSWTNPADPSLTGVMIRRAVGLTPPATATTGTLVTNAATPATSFTDTALPQGTQYSYALFAHDGTPLYATAGMVNATTTTLATPPGPVSNVNASPSSTSVALSWTNPPEASLTGVMIRRVAGEIPPSSPTAGTLVADLAKPATTFTDTTVAEGTQYTYALFAHDAITVYALGAPRTVITTTAGLPSISGTVTDAGGAHHGLGGVVVTVRYVGLSPAAAAFRAATTAADGSYRVNGLPARTDYTVCFSGPDGRGGSSDAFGYVDQCWKARSLAGTPTPVAVTSGVPATGIDAPLLEGGAVSGMVTEAAGIHHGLANVFVSADSRSTGSYRYAQSAADGSYTVKGLAPGADYTLCFTSFGSTGGSTDWLGYSDQCYDNHAAPAAPVPVTVTPGVTMTGVGAALTVGGAVSGRVTDASGAAGLGAVWVTVSSRFTGVTWGHTTTADGSYIVRGIPAGTDYEVCFHAAIARGGPTDKAGYVDQCWRGQPVTGAPTLVPVTPGGTLTRIDAALVSK